MFPRLRDTTSRLIILLRTTYLGITHPGTIAPRLSVTTDTQTTIVTTIGTIETKTKTKTMTMIEVAAAVGSLKATSGGLL
jgi:hypothetical protein